MNDDHRYVVPSARGQEFHFHNDAVAYFDPSHAQIEAFESGLTAFLRGSAEPRAAGVADKLGDYRRQFVGVVRNGSRQIFGNFFCSDEPVTSPLFVMDGGDCYFTVYYDPEARSFSGLFINGES